MPLLEWLIEGNRTDRIGAVDGGPRALESRPRHVVDFRAGIAITAVIAVVILIALSADGVGNVAKWLFAFVFYLWVGYLIRPKPNYDNIGWLGGLMDNPFRWTDGYNRMLLWVLVLFLPGRFMSTSLAEFVALRLPDRPAT
jgi:hypothetical protein